MILCLWTRWAIFIYWDRQLFWQFYVFQRVMSFLDQDTLVARWFFFVLNKICNFYWVDIVHFPGTLLKKTKNNWCSTFSLVRNDKNPKMAKNLLSEKFHIGNDCCWMLWNERFDFTASQRVPCWALSSVSFLPNFGSDHRVRCWSVVVSAQMNEVGLTWLDLKYLVISERAAWRHLEVLFGINRPLAWLLHFSLWEKFERCMQHYIIWLFCFESTCLWLWCYVLACEKSMSDAHSIASFEGCVWNQAVFGCDVMF